MPYVLLEGTTFDTERRGHGACRVGGPLCIQQGAGSSTGEPGRSEHATTRPLRAVCALPAGMAAVGEIARQEPVISRSTGCVHRRQSGHEGRDASGDLGGALDERRVTHRIEAPQPRQARLPQFDRHGIGAVERIKNRELLEDVRQGPWILTAEDHLDGWTERRRFHQLVPVDVGDHALRGPSPICNDPGGVTGLRLKADGGVA